MRPTPDTVWPSLTEPGWEETARTLHLWTQMVGKVCLELQPMVNHWWQVPLWVSARGLVTHLLHQHGRALQLEFDLREHLLEVRSSDGGERALELPRHGTLASFHRELFDALGRLGFDVEIHPRAVEIPETILLDRDRAARRYEPEWANRLFRVLLQAERLLTEFRSDYRGKASPVHFFWGSCDLAVSRFSGRPAPRHPGGAPNCPPHVMEEAYSEEVCSAGFWPGNAQRPQPLFYSYVYPEPRGYRDAEVEPAAAFYDADLREFVLPYEVVRSSASPDAPVTSFLESTWRVAARLSDWHTPVRPHQELEETHGLRM